jgi:hypothetical protein
MNSELLASRRSWWTAFIAIALLAIAMRAAGIGKWSFASDELGTFIEAEQIVGKRTMAADDPDRNVAYMIPLASSLHALGHKLFGTDEAGSRTLPAIFGVLQILFVGIGLRDLVGKTTALAAMLLLTLAPEHLFYCQYHRFYATATFFVSISFLSTARAIRSGSGAWMTASVVAAMLAVLVHALVGVIFGGMVGAILLARLWRVGSSSNRPLWIALAGCAIAAAFAIFYVYPLGREKALGYSWTGYSMPRAVLSGVSQVGWPVVVLAVPGAILLWKRDRAQAIFWVFHAFVWLGSLVVLPLMIPFHSAYVFALTLPVFVLAAVTVAELTNAIVARSPLAALGVFVMLPLLSLPSIVSHYRDGSRHDFRAAANWIGDRVGPDDLIVAIQGDKLSYYRPELTGRWQRLPNKGFEKWLDERRPANGKVWFMLPSGREGLPEPWRDWLLKNARLQTTIVHRRFDYHEYPVFILLEDR